MPSRKGFLSVLLTLLVWHGFLSFYKSSVRLSAVSKTSVRRLMTSQDASLELWSHKFSINMKCCCYWTDVGKLLPCNIDANPKGPWISPGWPWTTREPVVLVPLCVLLKPIHVNVLYIHPFMAFGDTSETQISKPWRPAINRTQEVRLALCPALKNVLEPCVADHLSLTGFSFHASGNRQFNLGPSENIPAAFCRPPLGGLVPVEVWGLDRTCTRTSTPGFYLAFPPCSCGEIKAFVAPLSQLCSLGCACRR